MLQGYMHEDPQIPIEINVERLIPTLSESLGMPHGVDLNAVLR